MSSTSPVTDIPVVGEHRTRLIYSHSFVTLSNTWKDRKYQLALLFGGVPTAYCIYHILRVLALVICLGFWSCCACVHFLELDLRRSDIRGKTSGTLSTKDNHGNYNSSIRFVEHAGQFDLERQGIVRNDKILELERQCTRLQALLDDERHANQALAKMNEEQEKKIQELEDSWDQQYEERSEMEKQHEAEKKTFEDSLRYLRVQLEVAQNAINISGDSEKLLEAERKRKNAEQRNDNLALLVKRLERDLSEVISQNDSHIQSIRDLESQR